MRHPSSFAFFILFTAVGQAQTVPPEQIGLSAIGQERITNYLQRECDEQRIAGAVAAVSRHGRIGYLKAIGKQDLESGEPMREDSLFRIASMTKAITSAAVMSLVEDGVISLDDPVSQYLPEFGTPRRIFSDENSSETTGISIHDLLTHRSGLTYGWFGPEELDAVYREQEINNLFEPTDETIGDRVSRIARLPLKFKPGTAWDYGVSTDVLGRVVEVASGLTLEQFFYERFFRPLGMNDTHFCVPEAKHRRLATLYTLGDADQLEAVGATPIQRSFFRFSADYCTVRSDFFSGGGGLVSSTGDYLRFLHMLLRGGELDGVRVLKRETVEQMTANQIGDLKIYLPGHGDGFGFGFGVVTDRGGDADEFSVGTYSWGGIFNTYFWVDPQEELVAVLMTQVFPNDQLAIRDEFRKLVYAAIDDSGFERIYSYRPGEKYANPHFNARQLRVNAPEVSTHQEFASRSEPRSSGMARIRVDEDLRAIRRADLELQLWGGHPGTSNKRVTVNGRTTYCIPEVGTQQLNCTHQNPVFNLRPVDLVNGYNSLQFACDTGETFWGHYIVDMAKIRIGLSGNDARLLAKELVGFSARVSVSPSDVGEDFDLQLDVPAEFRERIAGVRYEGRFYGYDENGDGWSNGWHFVGEAGPKGIAVFSTRMLPAQRRVRFRAVVTFKDAADLQFRTPVTQDFEVAERREECVRLFTSSSLPSPFWSRNSKAKECTIDLDVEPESIAEAELHVVAWTGGAGEVSAYFTLNGKHFPVAEGSNHETVYTRLPIDPKYLRRGENRFVLRSDTKHHGIEIMLPGPGLMVRYAKPLNKTLPVATRDAGGAGVDLATAEYRTLDCYKITTATATYYLDKIGAGLAGMIDREGNDWISFDPTKGTGAAGEYRGFPNAVFKEAGSYFHARNAGTDPCTTKVESLSPERVVISAESDNGKWAGRYTFTPTECIFTMTKMPEGHKYWVLYEGTPGGDYEDSDWWIDSSSSKKHPMTERHDRDLAGADGLGEWIAFGDDDSSQVLVLSHLEDDKHPDRFYQMQKKMTVFGFGRSGMTKYLDSVPQSFSISLRNNIPSGPNVVSRPTQESLRNEDLSQAFAQFALTQQGDATRGKLLFGDERTKCASCHQVGKAGGQVGPNLTNIGGKLDRPHLIDSMLHPSRQIGYGYETTIVVTEDGKTISGIAKESSDDHITLLDAENKRIRVPRREISATKVAKSSIMPNGLVELLSKQEFVDLVAYLETLGRGKSKFGAGTSGPINLPNGFQLTTVATGLSGAVAMEVAPDGRVLICEQGGTLKIIGSGAVPSGGSDSTLPIFESLKIPVELNWERGLIGVTVAPNFPTEPFVYVVYVTDKPFTHHRVSRFTLSGNTIDPASEEILLKGDDQSKFGGNVPAGHQGGGIHFGPDGKLYIGIGEQTAGKPAQRMDALQGKILRLNPDGSIPEDNPFLQETTGKYQAIWAKGCRNPFTFAFSSTGDLLINDVGGKFEEINRGLSGANYGWPGVDHGPTKEENISGPVHMYRQSCINGGDFCESSNWPSEYRGKYFFADFNQGWVKYIDPSAPEESHVFLSGIRRPVDLRFAPDGSLYVLLRNAWVVDDKFEGGTGALLKISRID